MLDLHKERLKHLMANAILELWKKETGSMSGVTIEGTVCITAASGRTTVVQVSDKYIGAIPEIKDSFTDPRLTISHNLLRHGGYMMKNGYAPHIDTYPGVPAYFAEMSPASIISPASNVSPNGGQPNRLSPPDSVSRKRPRRDDTMDVEVENIKQETADYDESESGFDENTSPVQNTNNNYSYNPESPPADDSSEHNSDTPIMSTPKGNSSKSANDSNGLDLTAKNCDDLALSTPQSYTAQVRDVIRQRLLATKNGDGSDIREDAITPQMLKSVGLTRVRGTEDENEDVNVTELSSDDRTQDSIRSSESISMKEEPSLMYSMGGGQPLFPMPYEPISIRPGMPPPVGPLHEILTQRKFEPFFGSSGFDGDVNGNNKDINGQSPDANGEQKTFKCEFCTKTFLFKSKYHEHLPVHTNARPFRCHLCSRTYKYKYDLRVHLRTHMGIPTKSTICPFCATKFESNKKLRLHINDCHMEHQKMMEEGRLPLPNPMPLSFGANRVNLSSPANLSGGSPSPAPSPSTVQPEALSATI